MRTENTNALQNQNGIDIYHLICPMGKTLQNSRRAYESLVPSSLSQKSTICLPFHFLWNGVLPSRVLNAIKKGFQSLILKV